MRDQPEREQVTEPEQDSGSYEAQAGTSAPAPTRDRQTQTDEETTTNRQPTDRQATDRQATHREPTEQRAAEGTAANQEGSGLIQDQRWQYFAGRWDSIQSGFVDDPRRTVEQADRLVAEVIDHLSKIFRDERAKLESQWSRGGKADTEDLRIAMQRYRDFFRTLVGR